MSRSRQQKMDFILASTHSTFRYWALTTLALFAVGVNIIAEYFVIRNLCVCALFLSSAYTQRIIPKTTLFFHSLDFAVGLRRIEMLADVRNIIFAIWTQYLAFANDPVRCEHPIFIRTAFFAYVNTIQQWDLAICEDCQHMREDFCAHQVENNKAPIWCSLSSILSVCARVNLHITKDGTSWNWIKTAPTQHDTSLCRSLYLCTKLSRALLALLLPNKFVCIRLRQRYAWQSHFRSPAKTPITALTPITIDIKFSCDAWFNILHIFPRCHQQKVFFATCTEIPFFASSHLSVNFVYIYLCVAQINMPFSQLSFFKFSSELSEKKIVKTYRNE